MRIFLKHSSKSGLNKYIFKHVKRIRTESAEVLQKYKLEQKLQEKAIYYNDKAKQYCHDHDCELF